MFVTITLLFKNCNTKNIAFQTDENLKSTNITDFLFRYKNLKMADINCLHFSKQKTFQTLLGLTENMAMMNGFEVCTNNVWVIRT